MKKYRLLFFLVFIIVLIGNIAVSSLFFDYFANRNYIDYLQASQNLRTEDFEKNSLLLTLPSNLDESAKYTLLEELSDQFSDSLIGYTQMDNIIMGTEGIRIISNYMFDEDFIKLVEGRMPDLTKTTSTYAEVLGLSGKTKIGSKVRLELTFEEETIVLNLEVVGTFYNLSFPYPSTYEIYPTTEVIVPDIQPIVGKALINIPSKTYFTFVGPEEKATANKFINKNDQYGSVSYFTPYTKLISENIKFYENENKKTLPLAIIIAVVITFFLIIVQSEILRKIKIKSGSTLIWFALTMLLGTVTTHLFVNKFRSFINIMDTVSTVPFTVGLVLGVFNTISVLIIFYIWRKKQNDTYQ